MPSHSINSITKYFSPLWYMQSYNPSPILVAHKTTPYPRQFWFLCCLHFWASTAHYTFNNATLPHSPSHDAQPISPATPVISQAIKANKQLTVSRSVLKPDHSHSHFSPDRAWWGVLVSALWRSPIKAEPQTSAPIQVSVELHHNLLHHLLAQLSTMTFFCVSDHWRAGRKKYWKSTEKAEKRQRNKRTERKKPA